MDSTQVVTPATPLVIGVGNLFRKDDAAGILAVRRLREKLGDCYPVMEHTGEGVTLMEAWKKFDRVYLVDAVSSGSAPGSIHRVDAVTTELPVAWFSCSTHNFGIAEAVELARTLDQLPPKLVVFGIEGGDFSPGEGLTEEVEQAVAQVAEELGALINRGEQGHA